VEYALPFGVLGRWIAGGYVRRKLEELFKYRHEVTAHLIASEHSSQTDGT
jgi:hypothetical protein